VICLCFIVYVMSLEKTKSGAKFAKIPIVNFFFGSTNMSKISGELLFVCCFALCGVLCLDFWMACVEKEKEAMMEKKLKDAKDELKDAKDELKDAKDELEKAEGKLKDAKDELEKAEGKLKKANTELVKADDKMDKLDEAKTNKDDTTYKRAEKAAVRAGKTYDTAQEGVASAQLVVSALKAKLASLIEGKRCFCF